MSYTPPTIPLNLNTANPGLKDLLNAFKIDTQLSINCHAVATIQSITTNDANGLLVVSATINYSRTYFDRQPNGTYQAKLVDYPQLVDCPLVVLGGGSTALTFPVSKGDQCLILFNDRDLNNWFAGASSGPVASARLHSFTDAIALVGFQKITSYDDTHALLTNGEAEVGVPADPASTQVRIANSTTTLNTLLGDLITAIKNISTTNAVVGAPCLISPASQAVLDGVATNLSQLLE